VGSNPIARSRIVKDFGPKARPRESGCRASHRGHQADVRLRQGALPRDQEEPASPGCRLGTGQSAHGATAPVALRAGVVRLFRAIRRLLNADIRPTNLNPSDRATEHTNRMPPAARSPVIQTFLNGTKSQGVDASRPGSPPSPPGATEAKGPDMSVTTPGQGSRVGCT
jgi:hypothetical protein